MSDLLRSQEMAEKYKTYRASGLMETGCALCERSAIELFIHWKVVKNHFPYDAIAETHNMLVPLRHVKETELNDDERAELLQIKTSYAQQYDYLLEATNRTKSIPAHFHLHLIIGKHRDQQ